jgi:peptidoglycan hydrolase-like protein with peptidoglycan-binding domain
VFTHEKLIRLARALRSIGSLEQADDVEGLLEHEEGPAGHPSGVSKIEDVRLGRDSLRMGDVDAEGDSSVEGAQELLLGKGYYMPAGADGDFGSQTEGAVLEFQERNKDSISQIISGEINKDTLLSLESPGSVGPEVSRSGSVAIDCSERELTIFMRSISTQESGGDYGAENVHSGAHGKYQIMPANWPGWSRQAARALNIPELEGSEKTPENQELVAKYKFCEYYKKYGDWWLVAAAWYSGSGGANRMRRLRASGQLARARKNISYKGEGSYPGIATYADHVMERYDRNIGVTSDSALASVPDDIDIKQGGTLILGDSQAVGNFGRHLGRAVPNLIENISGVGWTANDIPKGRIDQALSASNPELVVIALGGNGSDGGESELVDRLVAPGRKIVWVGAFPPTSPNRFPQESHWRKDLYTPEGVARARANRNGSNGTIKSSVGDRATFINPYDYMTDSDGVPGYMCAGQCDGIHLPSKVAKSFTAQISSEFA